jgi:hypothetical protein
LLIRRNEISLQIKVRFSGGNPRRVTIYDEGSIRIREGVSVRELKKRLEQQLGEPITLLENWSQKSTLKDIGLKDGSEVLIMYTNRVD